jgi:hypothetical protein
MMFRVFSITQSITYASHSAQKGPCGMVKVVIFWPLTTKSWAQFKASPRWVCGVKNWHRDRFFSKYFNFHISITPPMHHFQSSITEVIWQQMTELVKQDTQPTYNVTLRCICATIVTVENDKYYISWLCVCSLSYPACNMHAPYCHLWPVWFYYIFPHYLINAMI